MHARDGKTWRRRRKIRKKKFRTAFLVEPGDNESLISIDLLETLAIRILAYRPSRQPARDTNCLFKTLGDFHDDEFEASEDWNGDDYYFRCLNARQLGSIGHFLRRAILRHRWNEAAQLTQLLCSPGITLYRSTIISTCFLLLINNLKSNIFLFENFVRQCTRYVLTEEVKKFIKIIFVIREEPLTVLPVGKYIRQEQMYKVVDEICFNGL